MTSSKRNIALTAAGVLAILALGAGAGAGVYASVAPGTTTVVRDVGTSGALENASATSSAISVPAVYQQTHKGVVDVTVTQSGGSSAFGGSQAATAEGSGLVHDSKATSSRTSTSSAVRPRSRSPCGNGKTFKGISSGSDSSTDRSVVRISAPASMLTPPQVGNSDAVQVGSPVVAIGSRSALRRP